MNNPNFPFPGGPAPAGGQPNYAQPQAQPQFQGHAPAGPPQPQWPQQPAMPQPQGPAPAQYQQPAPAQAGNWAAAVAGAEDPTKKTPPLKEGHYVLDIEKIKYKPRNPAAPNSDDAVIFEFQVIESSNPEVPPGGIHSVYRSVTTPNGRSDVKEQMTYAIWGMDDPRCKAFDPKATPESEFANIMLFMTGDSQPAKGVRLFCHAYDVPTKKGGMFTKYNWSNMAPGETRGLEPRAAPAPAQAPAPAPVQGQPWGAPAPAQAPGGAPWGGQQGGGQQW